MDRAAVLKRRHKVLTHLCASMDLVARIRAGSGMAAITETLSPEVIEQLKPIVEADLRRQLSTIEADMVKLGVTMDLSTDPREVDAA